MTHNNISTHDSFVEAMARTRKKWARYIGLNKYQQLHHAFLDQVKKYYFGHQPKDHPYLFHCLVDRNCYKHVAKKAPQQEILYKLRHHRHRHHCSTYHQITPLNINKEIHVKHLNTYNR